MTLIPLECQKCGARLEVESEDTTYTCSYCRTTHALVTPGAPSPRNFLVMAERAFERREFGKAMQFIEQGLVLDPKHEELLRLETSVSAALAQLSEAGASDDARATADSQQLAEADNYKLQAEFVLHELQANIKVYGSNSMLTGATPADVPLALQYIDRSLELFPDNPVYLNLKALLLWEGGVDREQARKLLKRAAELAPRDINIQNNHKNIEASVTSGCFIATAAYGSEFAMEVRVLREWRDTKLLTSRVGRSFVRAYYLASPRLAGFIRERPRLRAWVRACLAPLVRRMR